MYYWSLFFHVMFAMFWIGGMLFTVAVLVPASRHRMFRNRRGELFTVVGTIFSRISWAVFLLMILTGILNLAGKGFSVGDLVSGTFWESRYGNTLFVKLHLFGLVLIVSVIHDFWLGPKAASLMDKDPENSVTKRYRKASTWCGRVTLLLALVVLWYALRLVR